MTRIKHLVLAVTIGSLPGCTGCGAHYSDGERTGTIVKLSKKGMVWPSYEAEMHLGHSTQGTTGANAWQFSAQDPEVVRQLDAARRSGQIVTVRYRQWWVKPSTIETEYVATSVLTSVR